MSWLLPRTVLWTIQTFEVFRPSKKSDCLASSLSNGSDTVTVHRNEFSHGGQHCLSKLLVSRRRWISLSTQPLEICQVGQTMAR